MTLPTYFQVVRALGAVIYRVRQIIGKGHPSGSGATPTNDVKALDDNATWLWAVSNKRRLLTYSPSNPLAETTTTAAASATPGATGNGVLRLRSYVRVAVGRDSTNSALEVLVDHEGGTVVVEVSDLGLTTFVGASHTATTRATWTSTLAGAANTIGARNLLVSVYAGATSTAHKIYGVRVREAEIPFSDL